MKHFPLKHFPLPSLRALLLCASFAPLTACTTVPDSSVYPKICAQEQVQCKANAFGLVIGSQAHVDTYLPVMEHASQQYLLHFRRAPSKAALVFNQDISKEMIEDIKNSGYGVALPWMDVEEKHSKIVEAFRAKIKAKQPNISGPALEAILGNIPMSSVKSIEEEKATIAHEFSHLWFMENYWPDKEGISIDENRYGGPAPDWLDEISAVLAENEIASKSRRNLLGKMARGEGELEFWPLVEYFSMEHPLMKVVEPMMQQRATQEMKEKGTSGSGPQIMVMNDADMAKMTGQFPGAIASRHPGGFYVQARGFADFIIDVTKDPYIFEIITKALKAGQSMEKWLGRDGTKYHLANSVAGLEIQWQSWLKDKYGK